MLKWLTSSRCLKKVKNPTTSEVPGLDFRSGNVKYDEELFQTMKKLTGTLALCSLPADALPHRRPGRLIAHTAAQQFSRKGERLESFLNETWKFIAAAPRYYIAWQFWESRLAGKGLSYGGWTSVGALGREGRSRRWEERMRCGHLRGRDSLGWGVKLCPHAAIGA